MDREKERKHGGNRLSWKGGKGRERKLWKRWKGEGENEGGRKTGRYGVRGREGGEKGNR